MKDKKTAYCEYCGREETYSCAEPEEKESDVRSDQQKARMRKRPRGPEADGKGRKRAKAYVLSADTYQEPYGSSISILFVSLDRGKAEAYRDSPENEYPSAEIHEIELDEAVDEYLGGYCE